MKNGKKRRSNNLKKITKRINQINEFLKPFANLEETISKLFKAIAFLIGVIILVVSYLMKII